MSDIPLISCKDLQEIHDRLERLAGRIERIEAWLDIPAEGSAPGEPAAEAGEAVELPAAEFAQPSFFSQAAPADASAEPLKQRLADLFDRPARKEPRPEKAEGVSWEALVGGKWLQWIGIVVAFFAMAYFLAWAWPFLPPAGRLMAGIFGGLAFLAVGERTRERLERGFSEGMTGGGLAILYLSIWAGTQRYGILPFEAAFVLMALVTALGVGLSVRCDAVSLSALSTLGGFLTPALLQGGGSGASQALPLLAYIALLNGGILAVSLFKRWRGATGLSFAATVLLVFGWAAGSYNDSHRWTLFAFVTLYFLFFAGAAVFYSLIRQEKAASEDLMLLFADTFVYALSGFGLLAGSTSGFPAAFPLALTAFFGLAAWAVRSLTPENITLLYSAGGLSILFLTVAIPVQLGQGWVVVAWSMEAAVLLSLGARFGSALFRRAGQVVWGISILSLLVWLPLSSPLPRVLFLNGQALPLLVSVFSTAGVYLWMRLSGRDSSDSAAPLYAVYAVLAGAWLAAQETYRAFGWRQTPSAAGGHAAEAFTVACLWAVYAVGVFYGGLRLRSQAVRLAALMVAAVAILMPLWISQIYSTGQWSPFVNLRWLSYVVIVLSLLAIGWMFSKEREAAQPSESDLLGILPAAVCLLALWGVTVELYNSFQWCQIPSPASWEAAALFAVAAFWGLFAAFLLAAGAAWQRRDLRFLACGIGGIGAFLLLIGSFDPESAGWGPVFNIRFLAFAVIAAVFALAPLAARQPLPEAERSFIGQAAILAAFVGLWGLTQETYETVRWFRGALGPHWDRIAQMAVSLVWTLCATLLLIAGIVRQHRMIRFFALSLFGLTIAKVFCFDLGFLETPYRVFSFGGLALALIGVSWLYKRYGVGREAKV
ncbi:MAG: DUF2339 domain-containing protein [Armatimonadetes bacterium]|nr:DUF2339 domain-containing protein [Armatimonadota bacterium]